MFWRDIFISGILPKVKVVAVLSKVFKIDEKKIRLIKNIDEITVNDGAPIICQTFKSATEFPLRLSIYIVDEKIVPHDDTTVIVKMSKEFEKDILIPDASNNPYLMQKICIDGSIEILSVDIEEYDNAEEFELL